MPLGFSARVKFKAGAVCPEWSGKHPLRASLHNRSAMEMRDFVRKNWQFH